jgi:hypothetical protein
VTSVLLAGLLMYRERNRICGRKHRLNMVSAA